MVEEGSVTGFIKIALELEDEVSGNLLLLLALSDSWCSFLGVGKPYFFATRQEYDLASHQRTSGMGMFWEGEVCPQSIP